ncbi:MAG TPA: hypothetical protein VF223_11095 [Trebonia sp.]
MGRKRLPEPATGGGDQGLQSVALGLLEERLSHCVAQAVAEGGDNAAGKVKEASDAIARLIRS